MTELGGAEQMPAARIAQVQALIDVRRLSDALRLIDAGLASEPDNAELLAVKALVHLERGEIDEARSWLHLALGRDPTDAWSYNLLASALLEAPVDKQGALRAAARATALAPYEPAFLYNLVRAEVADGKLKPAAETASRIRQQDPSSYLGPLAEAVVSLGRADRLLNPRIAIAFFVVVVTLGTGVLVLPALWLHYVLVRSRHLRAADEAIQQALARQPTAVGVRLMGADILSQRFRFAESVNQQLTAAALDSGAVDAAQLAHSISQRIAHVVLGAGVIWGAILAVLMIQVDTEVVPAAVASGVTVILGVLAAAVCLTFHRWQTQELPPLIIERVHRDASPFAAALVIASLAVMAGAGAADNGIHVAPFAWSLPWIALTITFWRRKRAAAAALV